MTKTGFRCYEEKQQGEASLWAESEKASQEEITQNGLLKGGWESAAQGTWKGRTTEWLSGVRKQSPPEGHGKLKRKKEGVEGH